MKTTHNPIRRSRGRPVQSLTGQTFGALTVLGDAPSAMNPTRWRCRCTCGNECEVLFGNLTSGNTQSCGCKRQINMKEVGESRWLKKYYHYEGTLYTVRELSRKLGIPYSTLYGDLKDIEPSVITREKYHGRQSTSHV